MFIVLYIESYNNTIPLHYYCNGLIISSINRAYVLYKMAVRIIYYSSINRYNKSLRFDNNEHKI